MRDNVRGDHRDILGPRSREAATGIVDAALEGSSLTAGTPSARCASARGRSESHSRQDFYAEFRMEVMIMRDRFRRWFSALPSSVRRLIVFLIGSTVLLAGVCAGLGNDVVSNVMTKIEGNLRGMAGDLDRQMKARAALKAGSAPSR